MSNNLKKIFDDQEIKTTKTNNKKAKLNIYGEVYI